MLPKTVMSNKKQR